MNKLPQDHDYRESPYPYIRCKFCAFYIQPLTGIENGIRCGYFWTEDCKHPTVKAGYICDKFKLKGKK